VKAKDLMTQQPCCCSPDDTIADVARMMRDHDCGSIPVIEAGSVIGIVTDRDLAMRALAEGRGGTVVVREVMTASPQCCDEEDDIASVERVMSDRQVRRVPILNADGGCVGIISQADLARATTEWLSDREVAATIENISQPEHDHLRSQSELRARL
jgi:CBS domain-containing protein